MKALISPQENNRIVAVAQQEFPVADPLLWLDCPISCTTEWTYSDGQFLVPFIKVPSPEELFNNKVEKIREALQSAIDVKAKALGFSNGNSLMLYAGFTNPFQSLAQTFAVWEAEVWYAAEQYKLEVLAGNLPMLSPEQSVAAMPEYPL